jgi:hypothetical protein
LKNAPLVRFERTYSLFCKIQFDGCAGLLVMGNSLIGRVSRHMPLLVHPGDHDA